MGSDSSSNSYITFMKNTDRINDIFRGKNKNFKEGRVYVCGRLVKGTLEAHHYILVKLTVINDDNCAKTNLNLGINKKNKKSNDDPINKKTYGIIYEWTQEKNEKFNSYFHFGFATGYHHICQDLGIYDIMEVYLSVLEASNELDNKYKLINNNCNDWTKIFLKKLNYIEREIRSSCGCKMNDNIVIIPD